MGIVPEDEQAFMPDESLPDKASKGFLYWIFVILVMIFIIGIGMLIIHWSLTTTTS